MQPAAGLRIDSARGAPMERVSTQKWRALFERTKRTSSNRRARRDWDSSGSSSNQMTRLLGSEDTERMLLAERVERVEMVEMAETAGTAARPTGKSKISADGSIASYILI